MQISFRPSRKISLLKTKLQTSSVHVFFLFNLVPIISIPEQYSTSIISVCTRLHRNACSHSHFSHLHQCTLSHGLLSTVLHYPEFLNDAKGHPEIGAKEIVIIQLMTDFVWKIAHFPSNLWQKKETKGRPFNDKN